MISDDFIIEVGRKYRGKRLGDIPLVELDNYLGEVEEWDSPYLTPKVITTIKALRAYLSDPVISQALEQGLED